MDRHAHTHTQTDNPHTSIFIAHFLSWWIAPHAGVSMFFNKGAKWLQLNQLNFWTIFQIGTKDLGLGISLFNEQERDMLQEHWKSPVAGQHSVVVPSLRRLGSLRFAFWYLVPWRNGTKLLGKRPESISFFLGSQGLLESGSSAIMAWRLVWSWNSDSEANCPAWAMSRETCLKRLWIWHQLRLIRCPAVGVIAEAWVVTSPVVDFGKMSLSTQPKRRKVLSSKAFHWCPVQSLVTFWRICRPNCMIWAGRCGNLMEFLGRWHGHVGSGSGCLQWWGNFWYSKLIRNGTSVSYF